MTKPSSKTERGFCMPSIQFHMHKDFHKHHEESQMDNSFFRCKRRTWINEHARIDQRREREMLTTLLSTQEEEYPTDCVDKLIEDNIAYNDLASLSTEDLELIGIKSSKQREELLSLFVTLPNQDSSYKNICESSSADVYNNQIISNAESHLTTMRASLAATNYKMKIMPPEDLVVGDKRYASYFALEALQSVKKLSDELLKDLKVLEDNADIANCNDKGREHEPKQNTDKKKLMASFFWVSSFTIGFVLAFWVWKSRKSS